MEPSKILSVSSHDAKDRDRDEKHREKKDKKDKKHKREKKDKKHKRSKKEKKDKKHKKHKRHKKDSDSDSSSSSSSSLDSISSTERKRKSGAVRDEYGKYGILQSSDLGIAKDAEFRVYIEEVRKVNPESVAPWQRKKLWEDFCEDFNTATMPSSKFYNLEAWERKEFIRAQRRKRREAENFTLEDEKRVFDDEGEIKRQRQREKEQAQHLEFQIALVDKQIAAREKEAESMRKILSGPGK